MMSNGGPSQVAGVVGAIAAVAPFTASSTTILMSVANPGWVLAGMLVGDLTTGQGLGPVQSYLGATLTLGAPVGSPSQGAADVLQFNFGTAAAWTTASTTISMSHLNPNGMVTPGMGVYDYNTGQWVGTVQSYVGTTLTLTAPAANASQGTLPSDGLQFVAIVQPSNTSGTFNFFPSLGECTLNALSRIRIRGPAVLAEHLHQAWMEANLMQVEWSNKGPNLWKVSESVVPVLPGLATYPVPSTAIMVLNVTIGTGDQPNETELTITPMTRQEYVMQPNKATPGRPTSFWFDRLIAPTITLWPTPDQAYNMHIWSYGQQFDASHRGAMQLDIPYRWLDAAAAGLAFRLAVHYAQDLEAQRKTMSDEAYRIAATQDTEDGSIYLLPMIQSYYD